MNGISTLTQKGQVVIPQPIRAMFNLKPASKLYFEVVDDKIIAHPLMSIDEAFGSIKSTKKFTEEDFKEAIASGIISKHVRKGI